MSAEKISETPKGKLRLSRNLAERDLREIESLDIYLSQGGNHEILSAEEEIELGKRIYEGREAAKILGQNSMGKKERQEMREKIVSGNLAQRELAESNTRLVISVAKRYIGRGVPFLDLIQEGNIGLIRAAKKFDYTKENKFSTYAVWWIRQAVTRYIANQSRTVRIPVHLHREINTFRNAQRRLQQSLERSPSLEELAKDLEWEPKKIKTVLTSMMEILSLDRVLNEDEDEGDQSMFVELVSTDENDDPETKLSKKTLKEDIHQLLQHLPPRDRKVLSLYFSLNGTKKSSKEIAEMLGVSRNAVGQIVNRSLLRLSSLKEAQNLKVYFEE